jgi:hypothetical protein
VGIRRTAPALLALGLLFLGCASPSITQLIVVVDTDLEMPSEIDHLSIAVTGPSRMSIEQEAALTGQEALPFTLTVVPNGDALGPVEILVSASRGTGATPVITRRASVTLVRGETRVVLLHLVRTCIAVTCAASETCTESGCARVDQTPLYPWSGAPPRLGQDAGPAIDAGRDAGPVDAGDAGPRDASLDAPIVIDSGPDCTTLGCDDMNACTDDVCDPATRACEHRPLDIACDDGLFCNGFDTCGAGTCSVHAGNPCLGSTVCDEARSGCTGCTSDAMCPAAMTGDWGECTGFTDSCGNGGTHARIVRSFRCMADVCVGSDAAEAGPCAVDRTGASCMPTTCGGFGVCAEAGGGACGTSGTATRTCTDHTCQGSACTAASRSEATSCTRSTDGVSCGAASCGGWSGCGGFEGTCDTSGEESRDCSAPVCAGGSCASMGYTETQSCGRSTDGASCGSTSCDGWGTCNFGSTCATEGTQDRTCYDPICSGGGCAMRSRTESRGCSRATDGTSCGASVCSAFSCTAGFGEYDCDQDGFEERTCNDPVCGGGTCQPGAARVELGAGCIINMDGTECFGGGGCFYCYSGSCSYVCGF